VWCDGLEHQAASSNLSALTHTDVAQHGGTRANEDVVRDLGVAVTVVLACATKGDILGKQGEGQGEEGWRRGRGSSC